MPYILQHLFSDLDPFDDREPDVPVPDRSSTEYPAWLALYVAGGHFSRAGLGPGWLRLEQRWGQSCEPRGCSGACLAPGSDQGRGPKGACGEELGGGSYGRVYAVALCGSSVAVKVFAELGRDGRDSAPSELSTLWRLRASPYVLHMYGAGPLRVDGSVRRACVLEQAAGALDHGGYGHDFGPGQAPLWALEPEQWRRFVVQQAVYLHDALQGLAAMHQLDLVHGDVKPENFFRFDGPIGRCKIGDFGSSQPHRGRNGTLLFMTPDDFSSGTDAKSDLFAAGVAFHDLVFGSMPSYGDEGWHEGFVGAVMRRMMQAFKNEDGAYDPEAFVPNVPDEVAWYEFAVPLSEEAENTGRSHFGDQWPRVRHGVVVGELRTAPGYRLEGSPGPFQEIGTVERGPSTRFTVQQHLSAGPGAWTGRWEAAPPRASFDAAWVRPVTRRAFLRPLRAVLVSLLALEPDARGGGSAQVAAATLQQWLQALPEGNPAAEPPHVAAPLCK